MNPENGASISNVIESAERFVGRGPAETNGYFDIGSDLQIAQVFLEDFEK